MVSPVRPSSAPKAQATYEAVQIAKSVGPAIQRGGAEKNLGQDLFTRMDELVEKDGKIAQGEVEEAVDRLAPDARVKALKLSEQINRAGGRYENGMTNIMGVFGLSSLGLAVFGVWSMAVPLAVTGGLLMGGYHLLMRKGSAEAAENKQALRELFRQAL